MRIVLITQNDPFFLSDNIRYLLERKPAYANIVAAVVFATSPFGKKIGKVQKFAETVKIFGFRFALYYGLKLLSRKLSAPSVKSVLSKNGVQLINLETGINHPEALKTIREARPDLLISIAGNQIFKKPLIELAPLGCLNLHTSLLPKYRGLMPSFWVLRNNEQYTGVSVFFVDEGIDSGPIIVQKTVAIGDLSQNELIRLTKRIGMDAIIESIELIHTKNYRLMDNDSAGMTYFSFPRREDVKIFKKIGKRFF